jgi:hypothetical protein
MQDLVTSIDASLAERDEWLAAAGHDCVFQDIDTPAQLADSVRRLQTFAS